MSWQEYMSYEPLDIKSRPFNAIEVEVESNFDRITALLAGIPGGANRAVGSALARAAAAGKTVAKRAVTQEYAISSSEFTNRTKNINNIQRASSGEAVLAFARMLAKSK